MKAAMRSLIFVALGLLLGGTAMATEEPKFEILSKDNTIEVRRYLPFIVAETWVDGDMSEASNKGFRAVAGYIFGDNQAAGSTSSTKIAMTAPVTVEPTAPSKKIAMTAPVTIEPQTGTALNLEGAKRWRVHFVMPSQYTLATLPKPNNTAITLREVPAKTWAVLSFSGFNTEARVQQHTDELLAWLATRKMAFVGSPQLARYDPPWTLPLFRRNEVMVEISPP